MKLSLERMLQIADLEARIYEGLMKLGDGSFTEAEAADFARRTVDNYGLVISWRGQCPRGIIRPVFCTVCDTGHLLECHYPFTCSEAKCSHYVRGN